MIRSNSIVRVVYKMVGLHESGRPQLVYIGQTTDFDRRVLQHKAELHDAVVNARRRLQKPFRTKYDKLVQHFRVGRVVFEKVAEGAWTWEEAVLRETQTILEFRRSNDVTVLNKLDCPEDGSMPEGRVAKLKTGQTVLSALAGLKPGSEAILIEKTGREIVRVHAKVSGPERGIEVWTFQRTGEKWTEGHMPWSIGLRVYRGPMLTLFKSRGVELPLDRPNPDEHTLALAKSLRGALVIPPDRERQKRLLNAVESDKPITTAKRKRRKVQSPALEAAGKVASKKLAKFKITRPRFYGPVPQRLQAVVNSITDWEKNLISHAVKASKGDMNALRQMRGMLRSTLTG